MMDCVVSIKGLLWNFAADKNKPHGGGTKGANGVADFTCNGGLEQCTDNSQDFTRIIPGEYMCMKGSKYNHAGVCIESPTESKRGKAFECTTSWGANKCIIAEFDTQGNRYYNGVRMTAKWTWHGKLEYIDFSDSPEPTPTPTEYPFEGIVKKGSPLYNIDGEKYSNGASKDRDVTVEGEVNGRYKVYGSTFNPHIVYVDKENVTKKGNGYPFPAIIRKGSQLYDINGNKYNKTQANRKITVQGEVNGRYQIYGDTFNPHVVYCNKDAIIK